MNRFNTNGGYFAPQGYLRINKGGSHDENPNGGVQLGVDGQGVPNLLEENEPVYNDFVYSDNIKADPKILEQFNIPKKYAGKLYSVIADDYVDEAALNPNDPISNNGLNAMLVRLADAQEAQKQMEEQRALEEELAKMSPEEQEALMAMMEQEAAQGDGARVDGQGMSPEDAAMMQEPQMSSENIAAMQGGAPQDMAMQGMPVMADGGFIRRFDLGGDTPPTPMYPEGYYPDSPFYSGQQPISLAPVSPVNTPGAVQLQETPAPVETVYSQQKPLYLNPDKETDVNKGGFLRVNPETGELEDDITPAVVTAFPGKSQAWVDAEVGPNSIKKRIPAATDAFAKTAYDMYKDNMALQLLTGTPGAFVDFLDSAMTGNIQDAAQAGLFTLLTAGKWRFLQKGKAAARIAKRKAAYEATRDALVKSKEARVQARVDMEKLAADMQNKAKEIASLKDEAAIKKAQGELQDLFDNFDTLRKAYKDARGKVRSGRWSKAGKKIALDASKVGGSFWGVTSDVADPNQKTPTWKKWTRGVAGLGAAGGAAYGISKLVDLNNNDNAATTDYDFDSLPDDYSPYSDGGFIRRFDDGGPKGNEADTAYQKPLTTLPRYAGAIMNGITGLYNVAQRPDHYEPQTFIPVLPSGRMALENPVYRPLDESRTLNTMSAQNAGLLRTVRNAGLGPSTAQTLLIAGNNGTNAVGTAMAQMNLENMNRYNQTVSARNQNAQQLASFYSGINTQRAAALNEARLRNLQNALQIQQLNNAAEGEKYTAVSANLKALAQDLANMGKENFMLNQANERRDLNYKGAPDGTQGYGGQPTINIMVPGAEVEKKKCGGKITRKRQ